MNEEKRKWKRIKTERIRKMSTEMEKTEAEKEQTGSVHTSGSDAHHIYCRAFVD